MVEPQDSTAESRAQRVERLLKEGLERYGVDDSSGAIRAWREVLALDPDNTEARDYLESADRRNEGPGANTGELAGATAAVVQEASQLAEEGQFEAALELLSSASEADLCTLELHASIDLARSHLLRQYRTEIGNPDAMPRLDADAADVAKFNLPPEAGFLLSMVDGSTSIEELVSLSGMDAFDALRNLRGLLASGIVSIPA